MAAHIDVSSLVRDRHVDFAPLQRLGRISCSSSDAMEAISSVSRSCHSAGDALLSLGASLFIGDNDMLLGQANLFTKGTSFPQYAICP